MFTYVAHFDRKVGIYIAKKLFQFTSCKELSNPSRTDGFFRPCSRHLVRLSYGDLLNSFTIKARAWPYVSYDKLIFHTTSGLSCSKSESGLIFNQSKCKYQCITRKKSPVQSTYNINETPLESCDTEKDLGVWVSSNLTLDKQVTEQCA